jgi:hypothetical protein
MKARVIHDTEGAIVGLITFSPDAPPPSISLDAGQALTEVEVPAEVPKGTLDLSRLESEQQIGEALQELQVEVTTTARLVKRGRNRDR